MVSVWRGLLWLQVRLLELLQVKPLPSLCDTFAPLECLALPFQKANCGALTLVNKWHTPQCALFWCTYSWTLSRWRAHWVTSKWPSPWTVFPFEYWGASVVPRLYSIYIVSCFHIYTIIIYCGKRAFQKCSFPLCKFRHIPFVCGNETSAQRQARLTSPPGRREFRHCITVAPQTSCQEREINCW